MQFLHFPQIPVVADLPVGHNLQDHIYAGGLHFKINAPITFSHTRTFNGGNVAKYFTTGTGNADNDHHNVIDGTNANIAIDARH